MLEVYFAHPLTHIDHPLKEKLREELKFRLIKMYDPFEDENKILKKYGLNMKSKGYYTAPYYKLARELWFKDLHMLYKLDFLIAWIPEKTIDVPEVVVEAYRKDKYIQIISPIIHPSFAVYANQFFLSIGDYIHRRQYKWMEFKK